MRAALCSSYREIYLGCLGLLLIFLVSILGRSASASVSCVSCHLGVQEGVPFLFESHRRFVSGEKGSSRCVVCHLNNAQATQDSGKQSWLPIASEAQKRILNRHSYLGTPALPFSPSVPRYDRLGLARFLRQPFPRIFGSEESMIGVSDPDLAQAIKKVGSSSEESGVWIRFTAERRARGRESFQRLGCLNCHSAQSAESLSARVPKLRVGYPLISESYFRARVRSGAGGGSGPPVVWNHSVQSNRGQLIKKPRESLMPGFPQISSDEVFDLYAYVSSDSSDLESEKDARESPASLQLQDAELFRMVRTRVFDRSCRHCHTPSAISPEVVRNQLLSRGAGELMALPARGFNPLPSEKLSQALSPGTRCEDSVLLQRLKRRHDEWRGEGYHEGHGESVRGMPLSQAPVSRDLIRLVEQWTHAGCPGEKGERWCRPCSQE